MNAIDRISPSPQIVSFLSDHTICIGDRVLSSVSNNHPVIKTAIKTLSYFLTQRICRPCGNPGVPVRLELSDQPPAEMEHPDQGYELIATHDRITITGFGPSGLYYGVLSLIQMAERQGADLYIPNIRILDWPKLKTRGHFIECRYGSNLMELEDWKRVIDTLSNLKMNQLVVGVYGCWCIQYDNRISEYFYLPIPKYPELQTTVVTRYYSPTHGCWIDRETPTPMFKEDFFGELIRYGLAHGVTVFPLFNSLGHNTLIPRTYPAVSAKNASGAPTGHGFCLSSENTYRLLFDIFDHIIDTYLLPNGIDSFHIGLDEVREEIGTNPSNPIEVVSPWCECPECRKFTRQENFIRHAIKLISYLKARGMKHIYLYQDTLMTMECPDTFLVALKDADLLDVTVIDWWSYQDLDAMQMYHDLKPELGVRHTVKPWNGYYHWNILTSSIRNNTLIMQIADRDGAEGFQSYSAWDFSYDRTHHIQADYTWNFTGAGTENDASRRYTYRTFGAQAHLADEAFACLDELAEPFETQSGSYWVCDSLQHLLCFGCAYYFYSYVNANKPYPRNFPGEAIETLCKNRAENEIHLKRVVSLSTRAICAFQEITENPLLARRFQYEFENYRSLAEDYLALFEMIDLNAQGNFAAMRVLAQERCNARKQLMKLLESTKERYLLSSHMRNQSIFYQFFCDLADFLENDPKPLDFTDLRSISSEEFLKLR